MKTGKKTAVVTAVLLLVALLSTNIGAAGGGGWYVRRRSDHKQPTLDAAQEYIESYQAYYVDKQHGDDCEDKVLYLTFDAGYENGNVAKILDVLKEENVPGAFFILKNLIRHDLPLVRRMKDEGHLVCNHTMSHKDMTKCDAATFKAELEGLSGLYREALGEDMPAYYRPPEGRYSKENLEWAQALGYKTIFWSFAYADWDNAKQPTADAAKKKILDNTHNGAVILLHPTSATNAAILRDLIESWRAAGYRFGTLDELTGKCADQ